MPCSEAKPSEDRPAGSDPQASEDRTGSVDASIGAYLRAQRELRGIGLAELEAVTRIPRRSLERLEAGEFDAQPDGFARGFVRAVALALGLDPDETVTRMLPEPASAAAAVPGLDTRHLLAAGLLLVALAAGAGLWAVLDAAPGGGAAPDPEVVWRRDPVRALAAQVEDPGPPMAADPSAPPAPPRRAEELAAPDTGGEAPAP